MPKSAMTHEEALEAGFFGTVHDDTPNEAYTVAGVLAAKADAEAKAKTAPTKKTG